MERTRADVVSVCVCGGGGGGGGGGSVQLRPGSRIQ